MDTAYNHFAGLINQTSYEPNNSIHAIAFQSDGKVMVGGSFRRLGGNHSIDAPRPNRYTVFHRNDIAPRHNLARLIGDWGSTASAPNTPQGPGNMSFMQSSYSVDACNWPRGSCAATAFLAVSAPSPFPPRILPRLGLIIPMRWAGSRGYQGIQ
jgi:hypothetical protein